MLDRLGNDLNQLGSYGRDARGGVSRPTFSKPDIEARRFLIDLMVKAGLEVHTDAVANIVGIREGRSESPFVSTGSHIDTGVMWGTFDGALGVLGAIEAIRMLNDDKITTKLPIAIFSFTDEEGTYQGQAGSKYFARLLSKREVYETKNKYDGSKFADGVKNALMNDSLERFNIPTKNHIELHIEQGPILETENLQIGVVTGIVGIRWLYVTFRGKQAHAGACPMNLRRDPLIPASELALTVRQIALKHSEMVGTCGVVNVRPNVINAIPNEATVGVDLRSLDRNELEQAMHEVMDASKQLAAKEHCEVEVHSVSEVGNPTIFPEEIVSFVRRNAESLGYSYRLMPSRAGHDTQTIAYIANVGMIFVPSRGGISHAPEEWTDVEQAHRGVKLLEECLIKLAQGK